MAAGLAFTPGDSTPGNLTTANATAPQFNATAGSVTVVPANTTADGATVIPAAANKTGNATASPPGNSRTPVRLIVANSCGETIWPGVVTQAGTGPGTGGFELAPGASRVLFVSADWGGRVWGRTNCSFAGDGKRPSSRSGVDGNGAACLTGDCSGRLDCVDAGQVPTTLAEFTLQGGTAKNQTFYDISIVDGYNLPVAIVYHPSANTSWIPPNLTNCACIATAGHLSHLDLATVSYSPYRGPPDVHPHHHDNASDSSTAAAGYAYPPAYEPSQTNASLLRWCPFDLQKLPPPRPGGGGSAVFPYPDDDLPRPAFQPCLSACAATGAPRDCCTGPEYGSADACGPGGYAAAAKRVCPDAYTFAFDDGRSTFVVPAFLPPAEASSAPSSSAGEEGEFGWEVRFCPRGWRSTDILRVFRDEVGEIAAGGRLSERGMQRVRDWGYVEAMQERSGAPRLRPGEKRWLGTMVFGAAVAVGAVLAML